MGLHEAVLRFVDSANTAVFTTQQIADGDPVLHVSHDADGDWQFLPFETPQPSDAVLIHLAHLIARDATLVALSDMPIGWHAYRQAVGDPWIREAWPEGHEGVSPDS